MNRYLKCYQVVMRTVGPVFVGNGKEIKKKEYIFFDNKKTIGICDIQSLYIELKKRGRAVAFEEYLLGKGNMDLAGWFRQQKISTEEIKPFLKYTMDCGDAVIEGGSRLQIMECIKDAYGKPYIPGSSLKGMFRTILLGADILNNPEKYQGDKPGMLREAANRDIRTRYLRRNVEGIEQKAYRTLAREGTRPGDGVNDIMQGFIVSDSEPLPVESLVLCQKIDRHTDGSETDLPLLRECIKPETKIRFTITIDTAVCGLSEKEIREAVQLFAMNYYKNFTRAFDDIDMPKEDYVFCGGGCGFVSKTVVYPLYDKVEGMEFAQRVFEQTLPEKVKGQHKHDEDKKYGASPHTVKCTRYRGKLLEMGVCRIEEMRMVE